MNEKVSSLAGSLNAISVTLLPRASVVHRIVEGLLVVADQSMSRPRAAGLGRNMARCLPNVTGLA